MWFWCKSGAQVTFGVGVFFRLAKVANESWGRLFIEVVPKKSHWEKVCEFSCSHRTVQCVAPDGPVRVNNSNPALLCMVRHIAVGSTGQSGVYTGRSGECKEYFEDYFCRDITVLSSSSGMVTGWSGG